jgi:hypothetical protein
MTSEDRFVPGPRWRSIAAIWGGIGLVDATQTVVSMKAMGMHHAWVELFVFQLLGWLPWGAGHARGDAAERARTAKRALAERAH